MRIEAITRPKTGWSDRYVKAHMDLLSSKEAEEWVAVIDEFGKLLLSYIKTNVFQNESVKRQQKLLEEFCDIWQLSYSIGLLAILHQYQHLQDIMVFVDTWKEFYYKSKGLFCMYIQAPVLLSNIEIDNVLQLFGLSRQLCIITQHVNSSLINGLVVECSGRRFDTTILTQLKSVQRILSA